MNPIAEEDVRIVPANEASWDDLQAIFGTTDYPSRCQCQRFKVVGWIWRDSTQEERTTMLEVQTACGDPDAADTSGLVAAHLQWHLERQLRSLPLLERRAAGATGPP